MNGMGLRLRQSRHDRYNNHKMKLIELNPWWKTGEVDKEYKNLQKREKYKEILFLPLIKWLLK